jgi:hypothetical protein
MWANDIIPIRTLRSAIVSSVTKIIVRIRAY